ncbi:MAG: class I SAM-dependent methyltransferase [Elusimicrobia bacterium]|nr:class I SAM-dependent methyltransferase [Elusimicrobiota bacterium]
MLIATLLPLCPAARAAADAAKPGKKKRIFIYWKSGLQAVIRTQEAKIPRIDALLPILKLKKGMSVLDIGAGTGQQSYKMAAALRGTGHVYATDIDPQLVAYMGDQARARGLKNLQPVLVTADGVDPFYTSHKFDLVLIYDLISYIHDRVGYFSQIRRSLNPGGRVVVVGQPEADHYAFVPEDVVDWKGLVADLEREPQGSVFDRELVRQIRSMAGGPLSSVPPEELHRDILFQLNRCLYEDLFANFVDGDDVAPGLKLAPLERPYATWLVRRLRLAGMPGRNTAEILYIELRDVVTLNKLILIQRYRKYLRSDAPHPYIPSGPEGRWITGHNAITRDFRKAGYVQAAKIGFVPFQDVWIFSARPQGPVSGGKGRRTPPR